MFPGYFDTACLEANIQKPLLWIEQRLTASFDMAFSDNNGVCELLDGILL